MSYSAKPRDPPIAAEGGLAAQPASPPRDPYEALDDLMVVVEALCPAWPARATFRHVEGGVRL